MEIVGLVDKEDKAEVIWIAKLVIVGQRAQLLAQEATKWKCLEWITNIVLYVKQVIHEMGLNTLQP